MNIKLPNRENLYPAKINLKQVIALLTAFAVGVAITAVVLMNTRSRDQKHSASDVVTANATGDGADVTLSQKKVPYTVSVHFEEVILGEAEQQKKLEVMTQKVSAPFTATKNGLFNWEVFSQTKGMVFHGRGIYTVDLSGIDAKSFQVDDSSRTITIHIPAPELSVEFLPEETEFFDTANNLLRFGEMQLTPETMNEMEVRGKSLLTETLAADNEATDTANRFARLSVQELFQPLVTAQVNAAVSAANDEYAIPAYYTVEVVIDN